MKGPREKHDKRHYANFTGKPKNASKRNKLTTPILVIIMFSKFTNYIKNKLNKHQTLQIRNILLKI